MDKIEKEMLEKCAKLYMNDVDVAFDHIIAKNNAWYLGYLLGGAYNYADADYLAKKVIGMFGRDIEHLECECVHDDICLFWNTFKNRFENYQKYEEKMKADYGDILKQLD